jgi:hypothetical protein
MADNAELIMKFHPVPGAYVSVMSADFAGEAQAIDEVARAVDERRSLA